MLTHGAITLGKRRRVAELCGLRLLEVSYDPRLVMPPHAHRNANVSLVLDGSFRETAGDRTDDARPCSIVVKPRGTVHSNRFGAGPTRSLIIEITPEREDQLTGGLGLGPLRWIHGGPETAVILDLFRAFAEGADDLERRVVEGLTRIVSRPGPPPRAPGGRGAVLRRRAEAMLESRLDEPPRSRDLAEALGVHPVYLARLFRARYGCGPAAFRRRLQVLDAARRLAETDERLCAIALASGFADQSHMCRAFRQELNISPGRLRRLLRQES